MEEASQHVHLRFESTARGVGKVNAELVVNWSVAHDIIVVIPVHISHHHTSGVGRLEPTKR